MLMPLKRNKRLNFSFKFPILCWFEFYSNSISPPRELQFSFFTQQEVSMKKSLGTLAGIVLIALSGSALADEQLEIGQKIYDRAFGRGCGTCHDIASNPQLSANIKAGTLDRASFEKILKEGKGGMPKAIEEIMNNKAVIKAGYGEDQAVDALYAYISSK
ncbi:MAG: cytochrome c [Methylococcaceae bacterium]